MSKALREAVRLRAGHCCEYCGISQQTLPYALFQIEHIVSKQHGGETVSNNLALACHRCNLHKGPNLTGIDPRTNEVVRLFNPRTELWPTHFSIQDGIVIGLTPTGRATVRVLNMNEPARLRIRRALQPPPR